VTLDITLEMGDSFSTATAEEQVAKTKRNANTVPCNLATRDTAGGIFKLVLPFDGIIHCFLNFAKNFSERQKIQQ
jgi:hypothetical protein